MSKDEAQNLVHIATPRCDGKTLEEDAVRLDLCREAFELGARANLTWSGARVDFGSISVQRPYRMPYLCVAAAASDVELCKLFIGHKASLERRDTDRLGPLHYAALAGSYTVSDLLIRAGADVGAKDVRFRSPLYYAVAVGSRDISELLIRAGAKVDDRNDNQQTTLHLAAMVGSYDVSQLLIQSGAYVMATDDRGRTPLHYAAEGNWASGCKMLIRHGANLRVRDREGNTPIQVAARVGAMETRLVFEEAQENFMPIGVVNAAPSAVVAMPRRKVPKPLI